MQENTVKKANLSAEKTLKVIADIVLIGGIIGALICLFAIVEDFNPMGFATTVSVLLSTLVIWASMRVLSNISINLSDLNESQKQTLLLLEKSFESKEERDRVDERIVENSSSAKSINDLYKK